MSSQDFLWLNVGVGVLLLVAFWVGKKGMAQPSKLNLRKQGDASGKQTSSKDKNVVVRPAQVRFEDHDPNDNMRSLNAMFMFNGHTWDAYEALGIPPGSNWSAVESALKLAVNKASDPQSLEFLKAAAEAIRRTQ